MTKQNVIKRLREIENIKEVESIAPEMISLLVGMWSDIRSNEITHILTDNDLRFTRKISNIIDKCYNFPSYSFDVHFDIQDLCKYVEGF